LSDTIVIGHRNPDTDSCCAAWAYARFKNETDPSRKYVAAVCGPLQAQAKFVFANAGVEPPMYLKDVHPRVIDVARNDGMRLDLNDPIMMAFEDLDEHTISVVPVFEGPDNFVGIIGIHEMTRYFLASSLKSRPRYTFRTDNIQKVIPGRFIKRSATEEYNAPIMIGAMNLEDSKKRLADLAPVKPIMVVGNRPEIINHAIESELPAIILTGFGSGEWFEANFKGFKGTVFVSDLDTAETIRLLRLSVPVKHIMDSAPLTLAHDELFDAAKKTLLASEYRGLPVTKDGVFAGVVTRRSFIEKPRRKLILVDHNELGQAVLGSDDAEICEIIDHHRMGNEKTNTPIYLYAKPVGSTCSIVFGHYRMYGIEPDATSALLMLSGLLSDTMLLRSPTTTPEDRMYATDLARLAGVDLQEYGTLMLSQMSSLKTADAVQVIGADFKEYAQSGYSVGIGQVEVGSLTDIDEVKVKLQATLGNFRKDRNLSWAMLLVTDIVQEHSVLLTTLWPSAEKELPYRRLEDGVFDLPDVLSRKKQLLPEILRVLEALRKN
jgi:manganese-dependent inorganic pyrophosphatase